MAPRGNVKKRFGKTLITAPFRGAFVSLLEPEETDHGDRYQLTALFPPDADTKELEDALYDAMEADFGDEKDWPDGKNDVRPEDKFYDAGKKKYAGFTKGWHAISMSAVEAPGVIGPDKKEVLSKREIYAGRWMRAEVHVTTYDNKSRGVGVYINHVQLLDHDEAFSGRGEAADKFDEYKVKDRGRTRDDDEDDNDGGRGRGSSRGEGRRGARDEAEEERGSGRRGEGRSRGRDDDRDEADDARNDRGGRGRGEGREAPRSDSRDRDEGTRDRGRGRGRDDEDADEGGRSTSRGRGRDRDDDGERSTSRSRSRADEDDRDEPRSGSSRRSARDDDWN